MHIDFRSDTVTVPTQAMLAAMMNAKLGDDVFSEDPTIAELEHYAAQLFGKEAGLFCPSGTMTNQIAIRLHTKIGDDVICHELSHVYQYEGGGIAVNALCSVSFVGGPNGLITAQGVENAIQADDIHKPVSSLVVVENTMNKGGGVCYELSTLQEIQTVCKRNGLAFHLDGARIFNAIVAKGYTAKQIGDCFDTISICLSKGLGAPVGSVLVGSKAQIKQARRIRKVLGGGMRQAGFIAAAGLYALQNHVDRLKIDHQHAQYIKTALQKCSAIESVHPVETNIVIGTLKPTVDAKVFLEDLKQKGILGISMGGKLIRFVTHLNVSEEQVHAACKVLENY